MQPETGLTTFCDDIRYELGGKFSLMSIYCRQDMIVQGFPVQLPKLGLSVLYFEHPRSHTEILSWPSPYPGDPDRDPILHGSG